MLSGCPAVSTGLEVPTWSPQANSHQHPPHTHLQLLAGGTTRSPSCTRQLATAARATAAPEAHGCNGSFPGAPEYEGKAGSTSPRGDGSLRAPGFAQCGGAIISICGSVL